MLRDVFYYGNKPNVHPREKYAKNLADARNQASTEHFWIINEYCDYKNFDWDFDFEFLADEDVWAEDHINVWPSQHQKDSGTHLVNSSNKNPLIIYRNDVDIVKRKKEVSGCWVKLDNIDENKFDFSWHPDPNDPPYIYKWGCKFFPPEIKHVLEYRAPGATQEKYMSNIVELHPNWDYIVELYEIDYDKFDMSWRPNPLDPPFIYVWGNKYIDGKLKSTLEYHTPGATEKKYMPELIPVLPEWDRWNIVNKTVDRTKFDFSWRPDPREPAYIYVWGNKFEEGELKPTLEYHCPEATEVKYMGNTVEVLPEWDRWKIIKDIDTTTFDFTWRPDPREPALIYVFGNDQYDGTIMPTVEYVMEGATEKKYVHTWTKPKLKANKNLFQHLENSDGIDYSWAPNPTAPPYIYVWGNQWNKPEDKISIQYVVEGATEYKYMAERANRKPCMDNWEVPENVDTTGFDFSWEPSPADPAYIYEFGTQWQKTGGPKYIVEGATEKKYISFQKVKALPSQDNWVIPDNIDVTDFDFSWHPDNTDPLYIYQFGTQWAASGGPKYVIHGAKEVKYIDCLKVRALPNKNNWEMPAFIDVDNFDYSWHPYEEDEPYIYQFGTQHQKTGGPKYITPGTHKNSLISYVDRRVIKAIRLPNKKNFAILNNYKIKNFDWSWHPDTTEEPYIYVFGNTQYPAEIMPTIEYVVPGAKQIKYINDVVATLDVDMSNWVVPENLDTTNFDFSWKPNPKDPPYIYEFGTQHQITGGPRYVVEDATEVKYIDTMKCRALPTKENWVIPELVDITDFDFSWHPNRNDPAYIYVFGTQWALSGGPKYIVEGATEKKYVDVIIAKASPSMNNWEIPLDLDVSNFDFSWHPYEEDDPYIYEFGTQHQKTGGPRYIAPGADKTSSIKYIDRRILKAKKLPNKENWVVPDNIDESTIDFSWHPDNTEPAYIYEFPTQWNDRGGPRYIVPGATEYKYLSEPKTKTKYSLENWHVIEKIDRKTFDFSWVPHPDDPPFIYVFGNNQYPAEIMSTVEYRIPGATQIKYVDVLTATLAVDMTNWYIPENIDCTNFDFSWRPNPKDPPYIYEFGTQHQKTGGPRYIKSGGTERKYIDFPKVTALPSRKNWIVPSNVDITDFDFSWHPDYTDTPHVYVFGTQWALSGGPKYIVEGATQKKYIDGIIAKSIPNKENWEIPKDIDVTDFDFSWHPYEEDEEYIYEFGTQWQKTGGPRYISPGSTVDSSTKYIDRRILKAKKLPNKENWVVPDNIDETSIDFSWHPDNTEPAYIYEFPTQWNNRGGPRYVVPGATDFKYLDELKTKTKYSLENWHVIEKIDRKTFDFSWMPHPDDPPFIYVFGNQWHSAERMPTVEYRIPGATDRKYIDTITATLLPIKERWEIPANIETTDFDFSWVPDPYDPPFIYEFGTQHQKTGGPRFIVEGAKEIKYMDTQKAKALVCMDNWEIPKSIDITGFDFSWHPENTSLPYIYVFGTQWAISGGPKYVMPGAVEKKYVENIIAKANSNFENWIIPHDIDKDSFDFSWHPYEEDEPYIYQFGTQWQKTGGPRYIASGADSTSFTKYIDTRILKATKLPNRDNWVVPNNIDETSIDFSWHPDDTEPAYVYEFATVLYDRGGPRYYAKGATDKNSPKKYVGDIKAKLKFDTANWEIPENVDVSDFDFSWVPHPDDPLMIYQFGTQWQKTGGPRYVPIGAENSQIKYMDTSKAKKLPESSNFTILKNYKIKAFDYSWHPDVTEEPFIYVFGNTQYPAEVMPTIEYRVPGATQIKYINDVVAKLDIDMTNWVVPKNIETNNFDFSWVPNPKDPPYIYQFGTQWQKTGGPKYVVSNATEIKYVDTIKAKILSDKTNWIVEKDIKIKSFDYSWHPDATEEPYIYVFGNTQYPAEVMPTIKYIMEGATQTKYINDVVAKLDEDMSHWRNLDEIDKITFDFSWVPNPNDPPYIYEFATQHQKNGGPRYILPNATDIKYVDIKAERLPNLQNWEIPEGIDVDNFDFSWHPDNLSPAYVYQFGTVVNDKDGPIYNTPDNNGEIVYLPRVETEIKNKVYVPKPVTVKQYYIETNLQDLVNEHPNEVFWALNKNIDYSAFNFDWRPDIIHVAWESTYVSVFGSPEAESTHTYFINAKSYLEGYTDLKFIEDVELNETYLSNLFVKPDMFFVDRGNKESAHRFEKLKSIYGTRIQKTRYLNSWVDTINRCINRATSKLCWILNSELDYDEFNFNFYPNPWQMNMVHVFGTQWSHWGTTFLVNRETFSTDTKYIKIIEHLSNLNFIKDDLTKKAKATNCLYDVFFIDFGNKEMLKTFRQVQEKVGDASVSSVDYRDNYLNTFKEILKLVPDKKENYIWICSSICDYTNFDFTYICDPFAKEQLHVFPSDRQKYGDTFLVNINKLRELIGSMQKLQEYNKINFNQHQRVKRYSPPVITSEYDTHVASVLTNYNFPYAIFVTEDNKNIEAIDDEPMNLWSEEQKNIIISSVGATRITVPKEAKAYIETQLYDYPYIKKLDRLAKSNPLDIVYLSNGEKLADENYEHLLYLTKDLDNRVIRVDGVNGRVQAYHAAAQASNTPWMFTVFAKLKVSPKFDFNWQPDRLQIPKHYMFNAKNPINGLVYGHQGIIAYNKKLVLANVGFGLDFTLDDPHESVNMLSGVANFNTDPFSTWRTAFREVIKLRHDTTDISKERLEKWLTVADGDFAEYCIRGASDAIEYFEAVEGDYSKLKLSYEWSWLNEYFTNKYKSVISL